MWLALSSAMEKAQKSSVTYQQLLEQNRGKQSEFTIQIEKVFFIYSILFYFILFEANEKNYFII